MFDILLRGSQSFMKGRKGVAMEGNLQNTSHFGFFMEGYWQGTYDKYIKVDNKSQIITKFRKGEMRTALM